MSTRIKVFWLEPVDSIERDLRRYKSGSTCPLPWTYHNKSVVIGRDFKPRPGGDRDGYETQETKPEDFEGDPRWPSHCDCGYAFQPNDTWQVNDERLYKGDPSGELYTLRHAPAGAMWDAWWMGASSRGPDGIALVVRIPCGGDWAVDDGWTRTGNPRTGLVTVSPSIQSPTYHGHLWDGYLVSC